MFHKTSCLLFDGSTAMSDGIAQAAVLSKAIVVEGIPETVLHQIGHPDISDEAVGAMVVALSSLFLFILVFFGVIFFSMTLG